MKTNQETKCRGCGNQELKTRLVGQSLDLLGLAILIDTDHSLSLDVVTMHHLLTKEFRMQLHALKNEAQQQRGATCAVQE